MPKYKRTFKGVKKKPKKKKIKLYKPKNLTKMFSKLKFKKPRRKPRKSKKIQKHLFSKQRPMITLRQKPKKKLLLNVYPLPIQSPLSIKPESHYQSFSYSDAQSSSYATGQKPQFKRKAQKEIDIDGHKEGQLLMQNNDRGIIIDY
jgi:hypothetical protein